MLDEMQEEEDDEEDTRNETKRTNNIMLDEMQGKKRKTNAG